MRLLLLLPLILASPGSLGDIVITTADDTKTVRSLSIVPVAGQLAVEYVDSAGRSGSLKCSDVVEIAMAPPTVPSTAPAPEEVELVTTAGDVIAGSLGDPAESAVTIVSPALGTAAYPYEQIDHIRFLANRGTWPRKPPAKRDADAVVTTSGDTRQGSIRSATRDGIVLHSLKLKRDVRVATADASCIYFLSLGDAPAEPADLYAMALLTDGGTLKGRIESLAEGVLTFVDLYGRKRAITAAAVAGLYFRNGRVTYLSDLPVSKADENANYIRLPAPLPSDLSFPHRRDRSVKEKPLRMRGQSFRKGIGVHARSSLSWALDGRYARFQAVVGIDDAALETAGGSEIGNVSFQVFADGEKLFDSGPVTSKDKPRPVSVPVDGRKELTLVVDFGTDRSGQGDLADWALARIVK